MKTKLSKVEFFAASPRLKDAYRHAAKQNKELARHASIHDLGGKIGQNVDHPVVVLAHAGDAWGNIASMAGAFHLLFTEPNTDPNLIVHWMNAARIRSEDRMHVVRVENLKARRVADLLGRVCAAFRSDDGQASIIDAYLMGSTLLVRGPKHRMLRVPISSIAALRGKSATDVQQFEIDPDGSFLYWPALDVHLGWDQLLQAGAPDEVRKAHQRSADFNRRYGAAVREVREAAGINQSHVPNLTDRQLRRIEHGECRATATALTSLAKAHGLGLNEYLDVLAKAM